MHQSKIAQRLDLYTYIPQGRQAQESQIPLNQIYFEKLGFLYLSSNESSQFQARELKSVYTDVATLLLKVVFHHPFMNELNMHN